MNFKRRKSKRIVSCKMCSNRWLGNHKERFSGKDKKQVEAFRLEIKQI